MVKVEYRNPQDVVVFKIFQIFDVFRHNTRLSNLEDQTQVVLLLLSLYKDGLIRSNSFDENNQFDDLSRYSNSSSIKIESLRIYEDVIQSLNFSLSKIDKNTFGRIYSIFLEIDKEFLANNFPAIFDDVLYRISESQGKHAGEFIQPVEITRLMCSLAATKKDAKVFNPFAGLASFGVYLNQEQDYFGQELNQKTWILGALRIIAHDRPTASNYVCNDSFLNWPDKSKKYDLIVSTPPYGLRLGNHLREIEPRIRTAEQFLIEKSIHSLTNEGKFIALIPQGFLFRGMHEQQLREFLVGEDLLDAIISLPGGLLSYTSIPLIILVISKKKLRPGKVLLIKADKYVLVKNPRVKVLNDSALNELIHERIEDEDALRIVDNAQIRENNFNLNVPRYFQKEFFETKNQQLVKLKDILEYIRGQKGNLPDNGKFVRIRDLKDDKVDFRLNVSNIEDVELRRPDVQRINESCILLAIRWQTLKPTYFDFEGTPIYRGQDILSFRVNKAIADYNYVINELHADYVQEQLESYRIGTTIPFIRKDDLLEVVIKLPSIEEQRAKVQGIVELSDKIKRLQEERNALTHGVSAKLYESVSTIKHSLGKPLLNIGSSLRNIEKALSKLNSDWEQVKLNERYDLTIKDSFDSIYSNLELVNSMLRNNESVLDVSNYELTDIDFLDFIKGYVKKIKLAEKDNVSTKLDIHPDIKDQLKNKVLLKASKELLEIGLNVIVENAYMHAFVDQSRKYKLEFRVNLYVAPSIKKQTNETIGRFNAYIKIEVANNGKPVPKGYSLEKLIRKNSFAGETGNTGQGGFDLNEIIKYHNNGISTLEFLTDDFTTEFTTTYSFLIPLNQ